MNPKTIISILVLAVVLLGGAYFLTGSPAQTGPIKIGFIGPLTGDVSSIGTVARAAVEVAVDEINTTGGINGRLIQVVYEDGRCDATAASAAALKLMTVDKVSAIIGGACSSETSAFVKQAIENKVPTISYCSSAPTLTGVGKYFFRDYPSDAYQGAFMAEYAYNTLGARDVSILYHISEAYTPIKDVFTERFVELGGTVTVTEGAAQTATDYRTQLIKIKSANSKFMYMPTYPDGGTVALTQAKELGISAQIFGGDAWGDPKLQKAVASLGTYLYSEPKTSTLSDEFKNKIQAKASTDSIPPCVPQAYDATYILANALKKAGTNPDKLAAALSATSYDGVTGRTQFDQNGDLVGAAYVVKKIENGTATEVE